MSKPFEIMAFFGLASLVGLTGCGPTFVAPPPDRSAPPPARALAAVLEAAAQAREAAALEALDPGRAARHRAARLARGTLEDLRAVGEDLFHRDAPWGGDPAKRVDPLRTGGADATRCLGCHRVGGTGGSGGFGDVAFFDAVGDDVLSARRRLPRMLAGAALLELAAKARKSPLPALAEAAAPFGWAPGRPTTLPAMVAWSARTHLGEDPTPDEVAALTVYLALLPPPAAWTPDRPGLAEAAARGEALFVEIGCAACHTPTLPVDDPVLPLGNGQTLDLSSFLSPDGQPPFAVRAYTDLAVHALGPALAERGDDRFTTPPLWGVASRGPYLHDGRAAEAAAARAAFLALGANQSDLLVFLASLGRPPRMEWIR